MHFRHTTMNSVRCP